jgi:hypothetical protein
VFGDTFNCNSPYCLFYPFHNCLSMNQNYFLCDSGYVNITKYSLQEFKGSFKAYVKNPYTLDTLSLSGDFKVNFKH